jgi:cell division transport system ATP-binding protein
MEQKLNSFPHRLSGGEQQRVAVARALLNDPDLIIADEPTGNLDPETSHEVMQLFEEIHRNGKSLLVATHNHQLIAHFGHPVVECAQQTLTLK